MIRNLYFLFKKLTLIEKVKYLLIIAISLFISFYLFSFFLTVFLAIFTFIITKNFMAKFFHKSSTEKNIDNIIYKNGKKIQLKEINPINRASRKK
jgi:hypothetical protein